MREAVECARAAERESGAARAEAVELATRLGDATTLCTLLGETKLQLEQGAQVRDCELRDLKTRIARVAADSGAAAKAAHAAHVAAAEKDVLFPACNMLKHIFERWGFFDTDDVGQRTGV